jgi:hypothetical protein
MDAMDVRDVEMLEIVVILDKKYEENLAGAVEMLKGAGMNITSADDDNSVVEGDVEAGKLKALEALDCVDYTRVVFRWEAEYPADDPRDTNHK